MTNFVPRKIITINNMAKNTLTIKDSVYCAPSTTFVFTAHTYDLLDASVSGNEIDDAVVDDWGTL